MIILNRSLAILCAGLNTKPERLSAINKYLRPEKSFLVLPDRPAKIDSRNDIGITSRVPS